MIEPDFSPLIAFPKAWSPSTQGLISGEAVYLEASNDEELEKYKGKLKGAIVLLSPPREPKAWFEAPGQRTSDERLLALANADPFASAGSGPGGPSGRFGQMTNEQRAAMQMQGKKWQLLYAEGAGVVLEPGRGDGGTLFVQSASLPAPAGSQPGGGFGRGGPRPWSPDAPAAIPQVVVAVEHYNRMIRTIKRGTPIKLQVAMQATFHADDLMSHNVIAEIPGTDLKDEVVMLGAHFDSWHSGTGATDNASGSSVCMEALRILKAVGANPRRTIRVALWTGEEQGLLGSRAYVTEHFGRRVDSATSAPRAATAGAADTTEQRSEGNTPGSGTQSQRGQRGPGKYELKPDHTKLAAYFNLDNGTGKIRGVYMQGNEACRPIFRAWLAPFKDLGASTLTLSNTGGTDHLSFDGVGLPGFQFIQDPIEYETRTHHSNMDVYDRVQEDDMKQASVIMASFVYHAAMRDEKLPRKPLVGEVVTTGQ
jgi:hypothetical protein